VRATSLVFSMLLVLASWRGISAKTAYDDSIELIVDSASHVAIVAVTNALDTAGVEWVGARADYQHIDARLVTILKGSPPNSVSFSPHVQRAFDLPALGDEYVVFFDEAMRIQRAIDLLFRRWEAVCTSDYNLITSRDSLIARVNRRVATSAERAHQPGSACANYVPRPLRFEVPWDTPASHALRSPIGRLYLDVPADPEHRSSILDSVYSTDERARATAATRLASYPGEDTIHELQGLLDDGSLGVRRAAIEALKTLCVHVPPIPDSAGSRRALPNAWYERLDSLCADTVVYSADEVDQRPIPVQVPSERYESLAQQLGQSGTVVLAAVIRCDGRVGQTKVVQGVSAVIDSAASTAFGKAVFKPALRNNRPASAWVEFPITFNRHFDSLQVPARVPVHTPQPEYPTSARKGARGEVVVWACVPWHGEVRDMVVEASTDPIFTDAALHAISQWRFQPLDKHTLVSSPWVRIPVMFNPP
jgi:TonB family protein